MQTNRLFVSACAAAVLGAITGATIDTTPLKRGFDAWDSVPTPATDAAAYDPAYPENLPDHYPIVTPQGRFEVGELRDRGLYRNRRFAQAAWWDDPDWWGDQSEPSYAVSRADLRYLPAERAPPRKPAPEPAAEEEPVVLAVAESEPLAPPPVEPPPSLAGSTRQTDLAADLAGRR